MTDSQDNNPTPDINPPRPFEIEEPDESEKEIEIIPPEEEK